MIGSRQSQRTAWTSIDTDGTRYSRSRQHAAINRIWDWGAKVWLSCHSYFVERAMLARLFGRSALPADEASPTQLPPRPRDEQALIVLAVFKHRGALIGDVLRVDDFVGLAGLEFSPRDLADGVDYGVDNGWLEETAEFGVKFPAAGHAKMHPVGLATNIIPPVSS
jgi:hypothetical protein